jgi:ribonucleoside-diphosphate reductase alpha chain
MDAFDSGVIKGVTTYRSGTMLSVLSAAVDELEKKTLNITDDFIIKTHAPKRPQELKSDVHHIKVMGQEYFVIVVLSLPPDIVE